jgi:hypothetical protein
MGRKQWQAIPGKSNHPTMPHDVSQGVTVPPTPVRRPLGSTIDLDYWPLRLPDGVGRHGWRMTSVRGTNSKTGQRMAPVPVPVTMIHRVSRARTKEGKEDDDPGFPISFPPYPPFFFCPFSLLHCLGCNLPFPLNYKRGSRVSRRGRAHYDPTTPQQHTRPQPTETWELFPLSTVCNPYCKLKCK